MIRTRYDSLDYLRGLMALAVLVFHFDKWLSGSWDAATLQGRLGVYAVSVFFILSGLTLSLVYENRLQLTVASWKEFYVKRFFRIFPLLWMATAATILLDDAPRSTSAILLNFSGLFGFVNPAADIATGAWSIGCELVYYMAFPTLLLLYRYVRSLFWFAFGSTLVCGAWIAFAWFSPEASAQSEWWSGYVQAANHAFFFVGGMAVGLSKGPCAKWPVSYWRALLLLCAWLFACWPIGHEPYQLVSGAHRVLFSGLSLVGVAAFFHSKLEIKGAAHSLLAWLGAVSYSLYLLHPLVFRAVQFVAAKGHLELGYWGIFIPALLLTAIGSHASYFFLEKPLANFRRKIA